VAKDRRAADREETSSPVADGVTLLGMNETIECELRSTDSAILETLPLYKPLASSELLSRDQNALLSHLSTACLGATSATLLLIENDRTWEAETVLRSVAEGSLKFAYLVSSPQNFLSRYREYTEALPDIAVLRSHERASELIELSGEPNAPQLQPYRELLVAQDRLDLLRRQYPRDVRGKLEQAWSFSGLVAALSKSQLKGADVFGALLHGYWSANQIAHMTWEGISMPIERRMRDESRRQAVENAHAARILSDCYSYNILRLHTGLEFVGADLTALRTLLADHKLKLRQSTDLWRAWHELEYPQQPWESANSPHNS
jgi:hypothetical protein